MKKSSETEQMRFCKSVKNGEEYWDNYSTMKKKAIEEAAKITGRLLEEEYGYNALHIGNLPNDWVKPGGLSTDNYCQTCDQMQS